MVKSYRYLRAHKRSYMDRPVDRKETRKRFLIVCEGEKTELNYFRCFRVPRLRVEIIGTGFNTENLVAEALKLARNAPEDDQYEKIWVVFDRDDFPIENFNKAIQIAKRNNINVAYSTQSFELWYLLHFHFFHTSLTRQEYYDQLKRCLEHDYHKNSPTMYSELLDKQKTAIRNAENLLTSYPNPDPYNDDPSTTVHLLVQELNRYSR